MLLSSVYDLWSVFIIENRPGLNFYDVIVKIYPQVKELMNEQ
jgi:hypothetical protein